MIQKLYKYLTSVPIVFLDGALYVCIAVTGFWMVMIASDEAGKYLELQTIFWTKVVIGTLDTALLSIKLFRSNSYSNHVAEQKATKTGNTEIFNK